MGRKIATPRAFIGISGYNYKGWRGAFYPRELPVREWLPFASRHFNSIELNGTFYSLKSPPVYRRWASETPDGFTFAIKGSRFITHNLKLTRARPALANFYASGILELGERTGPFLWQLPPNLGFTPERLETFLELLPQSGIGAARLAAEADPRLVPEPALTGRRIRYRHAVEPRHPSWFAPACYHLLQQYGVALVIADTAGKFPTAEVLTADFMYVRLHGSQALYASRYSDEELEHWAGRMVEWAESGRDVYVYFDNDAHAHAPHDALRLAHLARQRGLDVGYGDD